MATVKHTVVWGDTLSELAVKYNTTVQKLQALNGIENPDFIVVGQVLIISSDSTSAATVNKSMSPIVSSFGLQTGTDNTLFASWEWGQQNTEEFETMWYYDSGDSVWFVGSDAKTKYNHSTYNPPSNTSRVLFKVKAISKKHTVNGKETSYWTGSWSKQHVYDFNKILLETPPVPTVEIKSNRLTAEINNFNDTTATAIQFEVIRDDSKVASGGAGKIVTGHASFSCNVPLGHEYKVRCRGRKGSNSKTYVYGEWSDYSENKHSAPAAPSAILTCKAKSKTSVYLTWPRATGAVTYTIEYTTNKRYFDMSSEVTAINGIEGIQYEVTGLASGAEYFFRVRANGENTDEYSSWTPIVSTVVGSKPSAPTTWTSTTTVMVGQPLVLYWIQNSVDGSSETYAELEIYINGVKTIEKTIANTTDEDEKDKTRSYTFNTTSYLEGTKVEWRVRTAGVTKEYGEWSTMRTVDVYATPNLEMDVTDIDGNQVETVTAFPFYIKLVPGPNTQAPISYHVCITSNTRYETVDNLGNVKMVKRGEYVYSKVFDLSSTTVVVEINADNVDLENNIDYTITSTVSMDSGLTAETSSEITVSWSEQEYYPDAEIQIDTDIYAVAIRPYCEISEYKYVRVIYNIDDGIPQYVVTDQEVTPIGGYPIGRVSTTTGEPVFEGMDVDDNFFFYTILSNEENGNLVEGLTLSVHRINFDGTFTEIISGLPNTRSMYVIDPHPPLDYARYRIVAKEAATGAVSYRDLPVQPIGGKSIVIQWDEQWDVFTTSSADPLEEQPYQGSILKLPYNIDVTENTTPDVTFIEYAGRTHSVSYYGTHLKSSPSWSTVIPKDEVDTIQALRRLSIWKGNVYIREPSGVGYWASISVSFNQKHCDPVVPVSIDITRVEGGK